MSDGKQIVSEVAPNPFETLEVPEPESEPTLRKRSAIRWLIGYSAVFGALAIFLPDESALSFLVGLPFLINALRWCYADAQEHNYRIHTVMRFLLFFFFAFVFPLHILAVHGLRGFKVLGQTLLVLLAMMTIAIMAGVVVTVGGEFIGHPLLTE